ncbi:MAG TPA: heavy metal translocating P-type ATPase [Patescibacteria group bacterium]|nr:heavy metal translocating P-type ATPase [Patescibacteria group bacterium]
MSCCPEHKEESPMGHDQMDHTKMHMEKASHHETHAEHGHSMHGGKNATEDFLRRFGIVTVLLMPLFLFSSVGMSLFGYEDFAARRYFEFTIASGIFFFGIVFFEHAKHEIRAKKYGMMTLVSLAVGSGYLFSAASTFLPVLKTEFYLEISTLVWVLLFGHYLEAKSSSAAGDALQEVAKLLPKQAHVLRNGQVEEIDIDKVIEGDVVIVKPGEKVPSDGIIRKGEGSFNEAHISGESNPVEKKVGDTVIAGAINIDGSFEIMLTRVGASSTIGQIQKLISNAQQTKPTAQRIADRASRYLTFIALGVALTALFVWSSLAGETLVFAVTTAITVLVIACPHALGLAIPTVTTIATRLAVQHGVFIKDLSKLEVVKSVDYVVFDKTGTLTKGEFGVTDIQVFDSPSSEERFLSLAASLEQHSSHVLAEAVTRYAKEKHIVLHRVDKFKNRAGKGVQGEIQNEQFFLGNKTMMEEEKRFDEQSKNVYEQFSKEGKTVAFLTDTKKVLGVIALSDVVKPEAREAITILHRLGVKVAMLTGDSQEVAQAVAQTLQIDTFFAQVLPERKYEYITKLQQEEKKVMMVGDGVNDAPALTQANVGVAIGAGTDVAVEAGDIVLTRSNPKDIVSLLVLSRKVYRKMIENLVWALGYNVLAIPAAAGLFIPVGVRLTPEVGAILMSLSSVIVVLNAMTLRKASLAS